MTRIESISAGAKALYELNQTMVKDTVPWLECKGAVRLLYWKRAKAVIDAYERELSR
jgi:hypothetical protein